MTTVYSIEGRMSVYLARPRPFLSVPIDINYRCSVQRSDPHLQQMERISDISGRNRLRSGVIISSRLTSPCFRSFPRNPPPPPRKGEDELSHISRMEERLFLRFSLFIPHVSLSPSSVSFAPLSVALVPSHVWGRYHLSFCQLGDFNLLSFCAITGPRGPRKIVFNCD